MRVEAARAELGASMSMSMSMRAGGAASGLRCYARAACVRTISGATSGFAGDPRPSGRRSLRVGLALVVVLGLAASSGSLAAQTRPLDDVATATGWRAMPSDGVEMRLAREEGALRLDFDFKGHGGYAIAHKPIDLELPANYEFDFELRGVAPAENLEFKLSDADSANGANVWWLNRRDFRFPAEWTTVRTKKRQIGFAWGPAGGGEARRIASLEIVVTAGSGGKGTIWVRDLRLRELPSPSAEKAAPVATASSSADASVRALDLNTLGPWTSRGAGAQWLSLDFGQDREYGGLVLDWGAEPATSYAVEASDDGARWTTLHDVARGSGVRDYIRLPDGESRFLRLALRSGPGPRYALRKLRLLPSAFGDSPDSVTALRARDAPRGRFPRAYLGEQTYWTILGVPGSGREALLDTDGRLEPARGSFSIEPFLYADGRLWTWAEGAEETPSLRHGDLPIPSVRRDAGGLQLTVTAFALPDEHDSGSSQLWARYRVSNPGRAARRATLFLALRPFQVNPPWQFLATQGGAAPLSPIEYDGGIVRAGGLQVVSLTEPTGFGATTLDGGGVVPWLAQGQLPPDASARDVSEQATGALAYALRLPPGQTRDVFVQVPLGPEARPEAAAVPPAAAARLGNARLAGADSDWTESLGRVRIDLPDTAGGADVARALRTSLAYILLNRDGPALRPGSRSYARSWIRDGALMAAALLRLGHDAEVRDYIRWYAPYQFPSGKVPCCVDARGSDPVPENDSHGELIYLVAEYFRFTGDTALVRDVWPHVAAAAGYIDTLRAQRMTPAYASDSNHLFWGLLPESISHEGYSAKPEHSYWDDLWGLRGLEDASFLAGVLRLQPVAAQLAVQADTFRADIVASMRASMAAHGIDYVPGSAELGDFDATSTTIGVAPGGELGRLPEPALHETFERYWREFVTRRDALAQTPANGASGAAAEAAGTANRFENYTPYEWRVVGTFVRLGWRERAVEALRFFMHDRRPPAWNGWAEVVWRDPRTPRFIGDMPHTWVASDFLRSALDMLAYEQGDTALVVGAGVPAEWLAGTGVVVRGLRTRWGALDLDLRRVGDAVRVRLAGDLRPPAGGIVVRPPLPPAPASGWRARVNGQDTPVTGGDVVVHRLPADIEIRSSR